MRLVGSFVAITFVALTACNAVSDRTAADVRLPPEAPRAEPAMVESDETADSDAGPVRPRASARPVLDEPDLDAEVVSRARAALTCGWGRFGFHYECEAYRAFQSGLPVFKTPTARKTLVRMMEDPSDRVRLLGAMKLWDIDRKAPAMTARVLAAAERETSPIAAREMGIVAGGVDVTLPGVLEIVRRIAKEHPLFELRAGLLTRLLLKNPASDQALELVAELVDDPVPEVSFSAIASLPHRAEVSHESACAVLAKPLASTRPRVAGHAVRQSATMECTSLNDGILGVIDAAISRDKNPDVGLISSVRSICKSATSTPEQKAHGASLAERALKNEKNFVGHRIDAMKALVACEPKAGTAIVKLYRKDIDKRVSEAATDLTR